MVELLDYVKHFESALVDGGEDKLVRYWVARVKEKCAELGINPKDTLPTHLVSRSWEYF